MSNIFELSESPSLENTSSIVKSGMKIKTIEQPRVTGRTKVLKIVLGSTPYYHFSNVEFDDELATRKQDVVVGGKRFYMGLKNNSMHAKMKLTSLVTQ